MDKAIAEQQEQQMEDSKPKIGLTEDNQKELDEILDAQAPKEEPTEEPKKEDDLVDRLTKLEEKLEKTQSSSQARIDQLTAEKKQLAEELAELRKNSKEATPDPVQELVRQRDELLAQKRAIKKKIYEAQVDGDEDGFERLIKEETKLDLSILRLDKEYDKVENQKKTSELSKVQVERQKKWDDSIYKAIKRFPELQTEDGKLNTDSVLWKEAAKLMMANAKKPKNNKFLDYLNPSYDHSDGPYSAILEAHLSINSDQAKKKVKDVEKENQQLKAKEQLLSDSMANANAPSSDKKMAKHMEAIMDKGENASLDIEAFLKAKNKQLGHTK